MYGNPALLRTQEDSREQGIIIFPDIQAIEMPGTITFWSFYALDKVELLALQIWRQVHDLKVR